MIAKELLGLVGQILADPMVASAALILGAGLVGAWLLAALWVFQDSAYRSTSILARYLAATWVLVSGPVLLPMSLAAYAFVRPSGSAHERECQHLARAILTRELEVDACLGCRRRTDPGWRRCPTCATWLAAQCDHCQRWAPPDAEICPWCAAERRAPGSVPATFPPVRQPIGLRGIAAQRGA